MAVNSQPSIYTNKTVSLNLVCGCLCAEHLNHLVHLLGDVAVCTVRGKCLCIPLD